MQVSFVFLLCLWLEEVFKLSQTFWRELRWLNTVLEVCGYMSFANKLWQGKGCSSQAGKWKTTLKKDFDWQEKCAVFVVSMAIWTIDYCLEISLLLILHKIRSLYFPINLHIAYCNYNHYHLKPIWLSFNRRIFWDNQWYNCTVIINCVTKLVCSRIRLNITKC